MQELKSPVLIIHAIKKKILNILISIEILVIWKKLLALEKYLQKENESSHLQSTGTRALVEEETCNDREGFFFLKDILNGLSFGIKSIDFVIDNMQHIVSENYKPLSYRGYRPLNMPNMSSYRGYYRNSVYPLE